jgi:hypothetical protein
MKFRDQLKPNGTCSSCHWTKRTKGYKLCSTNYVSTSLCDACLLSASKGSIIEVSPSRQDRVNLPGDAWKPHMGFHGNIRGAVGGEPSDRAFHAWDCFLKGVIYIIYIIYNIIYIYNYIYYILFFKTEE